MTQSHNITSVTWWDSYAFINTCKENGIKVFDGTLFGIYDLPIEPFCDSDAGAEGLLTGQISAPLGTMPDQSVTKWHRTVWYYNYKESITRKIDGYCNDHIVRETAEYDFRELPTYRYRILYTGNNINITEQYHYTYDRWGRPLTTEHYLNEEDGVTILSHQYDTLGRLSSTRRGDYNSLTTTNTHNTRGWITGINSPQFSEHLFYESARDTSSVPCWNGNISSFDWRANVPADSLSAYNFHYDKMSRLVKAERVGAGGWNGYDREYSYDLNGNINQIRSTFYDENEGDYLQHYGTFDLFGNQMDTYSSRTYRMDGSSPSPPRFRHKVFNYDANGNLSSRYSKSIRYPAQIIFGPTDMAVEYNNLNLPSYRWNNSAKEWMVYDATGAKQALYHRSYGQTDSTDCKIEFVDNFIFINGSLSMTLFDGGYVDANRNYHWYLKDHLGNNRVIANEMGTVESTFDYDPYGGVPGYIDNDWAAIDTSFVFNGTNFRYGCKHRTESFLDYDFGARYYSTSHHRFTTMDPLAEKYYHLSPYAYCAGNPVRFVDLFGMEWEEKGNLITVYLNYTYNQDLSDRQIDRYKKNIQNLFNKIIYEASSGQYSGKVVFFQNNESILQTIDFGKFYDDSIGGSTQYLSSFINVFKNGRVINPRQVAQSSIHELFHTLRLAHPFEVTQSDDTELIKIGANQFSTTQFTDPNIRNNIMNYSSIQINGEYGTDLTHLTKGQFQFLLQEIRNQNQGSGFIGKGRTYEDYNHYWLNWPGIPVQ